MKRIAFALALSFAATATAQEVPSSPRIDGPMSLTRALSLAAQYSPALATSAADLAAAAAETSAARGRARPKLSANTFATTGSYASIFGSSPRVDPLYLLNTPSGPYLDQNLMLMVPLYTGGVLDATVRAAVAMQSASGGEAREVRGDVLLQTTDAYLRAQLAAKMTEAANAQVLADTELVRTTRAQFEAGKGIEANVRRSEAELSQAQRALTSARNDEAKALLDLKATIGLDPESSVTLSEAMAATPPEQALPEFIKSGLNDRGTLQAVRARAKAAHADVDAAEGLLRPQVYGVAMGDLASQSMGNGTSAGITLSLPLFDGGERRAEVSRARALKAKADAELRQAQITVEKEIRQAWLDVQTAQANAQSAESSVQSAQSAYDVVALRVSSGKGILVEQLDALQSLTRARADYAQAIYDHEIGVARLRKAAGISLDGPSK